MIGKSVSCVLQAFAPSAALESISSPASAAAPPAPPAPLLLELDAALELDVALELDEALELDAALELDEALELEAALLDDDVVLGPVDDDAVELELDPPPLPGIWFGVRPSQESIAAGAVKASPIASVRCRERLDGGIRAAMLPKTGAAR